MTRRAQGTRLPCDQKIPEFPVRSAAMGAGFCIQALFGNAKTLDGMTAQQMLLHDGLGVFRSDIAVPDGLGINHHHGPMLALVQASGLVDAHLAGKACLFDELGEAGMQITFSINGTGGARSAGGAGVVTDKNVVFECGQTNLLRKRLTQE
jgi:hypothetical protein